MVEDMEDMEDMEEIEERESGQDLILNQKADTLADAEAIASKKLRDANKRETTGSITMIGDMRFVGSGNIDITGWGKFDGKYFIEKATHSVSKGSGYVTSLELRLDGSQKGKGKDKGKTKYGPLDKNFPVYAQENNGGSSNGV
jgi:phage protein D